ncbi:MAG: hypothetical protein HKM05_08385 [Spirochaetales bacterium]|nr:hypothetical protein [Spirochaetales bacterium]
MNYLNKALIEGFSLRDPEVVELSQGEKVLRLTLDSRRINRRSDTLDFWSAEFNVVFPGTVSEDLLELLRQNLLIKVFGYLDQDKKRPHWSERPWSFVVADRVVLRPFSSSPDYQEFQILNQVWDRVKSENSF